MKELFAAASHRQGVELEVSLSNPDGTPVASAFKSHKQGSKLQDVERPVNNLRTCTQCIHVVV